MKKRIVLIAGLLILVFAGNPVLKQVNAETNQSKNKKSETLKTPEQIYKEANYVVKIEAWKFQKVPFIPFVPFINQMVPESVGFNSGSVIRCKKYGFCVLTANHGLEDPPYTFFAHFKDGSPPQKLELIAGSTTYDYAILQFSDSTFTPSKTAPIGKSSSLEVGTKILAIGSNNFGDFWFSADGYLYTEIGPLPLELQISFAASGITVYPVVMFIKTDIFRGYSGGPLLNGKGELVGIAVAAISLDNYKMGIGVPIDDIMKEIKKILKD